MGDVKSTLDSRQIVIPTCITCCKGCQPPKRHPGCHSVCEEYLEQRKQQDENNAKRRAEYTGRPAVIDNYSFDRIVVDRGTREYRSRSNRIVHR